MKYSTLLVIALVAVALSGLVGFTADTLLYAPEQEKAVSPFHENPAVLPEAYSPDSDEFAWLMQDIIDGQQQIVSSLARNDITAMKQNLTFYSQNYAWLEQTAGWLGMTGGDVRIFLAGTQDQQAILREMVNKSEALDALNAAGERSGDDKEAQATVASQVAAVKGAEVALLNRYLGDHAVVMKTCTIFGLDTQSYEQAGDEVREIIRTIEIDKEPVEVLKPPPGAAGRITLLVEPGEATYLDTVQVFGLVSPGEEGQDVTVSFDDDPFMTVTTDTEGNYLSRFTVEQVRTGDHRISAETGTITSSEQELTINAAATSTTLTAVPGYYNWSETGAYCNGSVTANLPVRNLPVVILAEGEAVMRTTTAENGTFREFVPLSPGSHTLVAQFSVEGYPLDPSRSSAIPVTVPSTPIRLIDILGIAALVFLVLGAVAWWLLRPGPEPGREEEDIGKIFPESLPAPDTRELPPEIGALFARYEALLREQGLSEAARRAYLDLAGRIAAHLRLPAYRTLTPREMSAICTGKRYSGIFDIFIDSYERIRYGGSTRTEDRAGFEEELQVADTETGRDV